MAYTQYRLETDAAPGINNKETWGAVTTGAIKGGAITSVIGLAPVGAAIGAAWGGIGEVTRQHNTQENGKVTKQVKEPSIFNGEMLVGGALGTLAAGATVAALPGLLGFALGMTVFGTAAVGAGALIGGNVGKNRMENELSEARVQHGQSKALMDQGRVATRQAELGQSQGISMSEIEAAKGRAPVQGGFVEREQARQAAMAQGQGVGV